MLIFIAILIIKQRAFSKFLKKYELLEKRFHRKTILFSDSHDNKKEPKVSVMLMIVIF